MNDNLPYNRAEEVNRFFIKSNIIANKKADRRNIARAWIHILTGEDLLLKEKWWGNYSEYQDGGNTKVKVTWRHGKTGSWMDDFHLVFNLDGELLSLKHVPNFT